ncbi:MAG TPA: homocysteine S-methyltransferase family protein [Chthonomonadaceae bacterium]|nr:homocysteine S-methyltransferase family protein [Chthonomonadaceae bacterium]
MPLMSGQALLQRLRKGERFLADGAMGTQLMRQGVRPERTLNVNSTRPIQISAIHHRYLEAGARILSSNTFGTDDPSHWERDFGCGLDLALHAARSSRENVAVLISMTTSTAQRLVDAHILPKEWPTGLLVETCISLKDAMMAAFLLASKQPELLAITCHFRADGRMPDGTTPEDAAAALHLAGAHVIGANCGDDPGRFPEIAVRMRAVTELPLLFQPSAGLPQAGANALEGIHYPVTPERFANLAHQLFEAGVHIVGGCCGTTPAHISAANQRSLSPRYSS